MAFGNNRSALQPRAKFQTAGGCIMKYSHPYLAGAIDQDTTKGRIDEIDVSACLKLAETFLRAEPNQDASSQTVLVDGSTVTITNHILNGTMRLPVIRTTGKVSSGDFLAALLLVMSSKDSIGGVFQRTIFINGEAHTRLYYGVSVKRIPHDILMGLEVPTYEVELFYAGFIDAISATGDTNLKAIWAVGSKTGVLGTYKPYGINDGGTLSDPMSTANAPNVGPNVQDELTSDANLATSDTEDVAGYPQITNPVIIQ